DVVERGSDLLGDGVNIAARLEGIADPGGICVSRTVFEQVANKIAVQFADIGEQQVKNIPQPVHAYAIGSKIEGATRRPTLSVQKTAEAKRAATMRWGFVATGAVAVLAVVAVAYLLGGHGQPTATPQASQAPQAPQAPLAP